MIEIAACTRTCNGTNRTRLNKKLNKVIAMKVPKTNTVLGTFAYP